MTVGMGPAGKGLGGPQEMKIERIRAEFPELAAEIETVAADEGVTVEAVIGRMAKLLATIEEERAAMEAQQMAAGVNGAAQTAKLMSETDVASPNALTALVGA